MTTVRDPEDGGATTRALWLEARELTYVLLQCMSGLVQDGRAVPGLENAAVPVVASILRAHADLHELWAQSIVSPIRLVGLERAARAAAQRPQQLLVEGPAPELADFVTARTAYVLAARTAASTAPALCALLYGLTMAEVEALRSMAAASVMILAQRARWSIDEAHAARLLQIMPRRDHPHAGPHAVVAAVLGSGLRPAEGEVPAGTAGGACAPARARKKVRVRAAEIRQCLLAPDTMGRIEALSYLYVHGLSSTALQTLRGVTRAELLLTGAGKYTARSPRYARSAYAIDPAWAKLSRVRQALLFVQILRAIDPAAAGGDVDPQAFAIAAQLLAAAGQQPPLTLGQQHRIARAYAGGLIAVATCAQHGLDYLIAHDACEFNVESACPACTAARSRRDPCTAEAVTIAAVA